MTKLFYVMEEKVEISKKLHFYVTFPPIFIKIHKFFQNFDIFEIFFKNLNICNEIWSFFQVWTFFFAFYTVFPSIFKNLNLHATLIFKFFLQFSTLFPAFRKIFQMKIRLGRDLHLSLLPFLFLFHFFAVFKFIKF